MNDNGVANILFSAKRTKIDHSFPFFDFFDKLQQETTCSLCLGAAISRSSGMAAFWKDSFNFTPSTPFFEGAFPLHISIKDTKIKKSISSIFDQGVDSQNTVR